jgi:eukaryotic-like serine/threonine-protein kinase
MSTNQLLARARTRVGTVLCGKYRLDAVLGAGGMASVFGATHLRNANRVAVKILHPELAIDEGLRARFLREGYASNLAEHPGAVRILDDDTAEDGSVFLVMELLEGEGLDAKWQRSGRMLAVPEVVSMMWQLLDVLAAAHAKGIVHRDVKPQNVMLLRDGRIKLLDFGVARLWELSFTATRTGALMGTPAFMAPEQALGRKPEVDALSDVWAAGATAFTLLSGRFVHAADTPEESLVRAATQPAPPLVSVAPHVPPAIARVVDRALAYAKSDRWTSARAMQQALAQAADEVAGASAADGRGGTQVTNTRPPAGFTPSSVGGLASIHGRIGRRSGRDVALVVAGVTTLIALGVGAATLTARSRRAASPNGLTREAPASAKEAKEPPSAIAVEPPLLATAVLEPVPIAPLEGAASAVPSPLPPASEGAVGPAPPVRTSSTPPTPPTGAPRAGPASPMTATGRSRVPPPAISKTASTPKRDPLAP